MNQTESKRLSERALRRLRKIGSGVEYSTQDPLLCEIALAQLDATLAVASAVRANTDLHALRDLEESVHQLRYQSYSVESILRSVDRLVNKYPEPAPRPAMRYPPRWQTRFRHWRYKVGRTLRALVP